MKVTYLFGAGASKNALPIVNELSDRINGVVRELNSFHRDNEEFRTFLNGLYYDNLFNETIDDLIRLANYSRAPNTMDTFAKKLFIKGDVHNLRRLKIAASVYFILEQALSGYDHRYDKFWASILGDSVNSFPQNLRIISWNYDTQFELSYSDYSNENSLNSNRIALNICSKVSFSNYRKENFSIFKLNGTTSLIETSFRNDLDFIKEFNTGFTFDFLKLIFLTLNTIKEKNNYSPSLSFAWEDTKNGIESIVSKVISETDNTEVLVVVGYSFPFFNRIIDSQIINNMKALKKVYFQSPQFEDLIDRFKSIRSNHDNIKLDGIRDVYQFFLPNEL